MAVNLNLLPQDYKVSDSVAKIIKIVRPLNVILLAVFLLSAIGVGAYFVYSTTVIENLDTTNTTLRNQVKSLQSAQQQAVLLKDRLGKIGKIYAKPAASKNLGAVDFLIKSLPPTTTINLMDIDAEKTGVTYAFATNTDLTNFLNLLNNQTNLDVTMTSFNYETTNGYVVGFSFVPKK
jgi:hypothetical protein